MEVGFTKERLCFMVVLVALMFELGGGQTLSHLKDLHKDLFTTNDYNYRMRPIADQSQYIGK